MLKKITVSCSPHISKHMSTRSIMIDVIIALAPAMLAACYYFRNRAVIILATCIVSALVTEWGCNLLRKKPNSLGDFSAVVTAIILALSLPPAIPFWVAIIGSVFAIAIGKMVFGGLGANIFNPAMVARAFLTASFGAMMTTFSVPAPIDLAMPKISAVNTTAVTQATPLAWSKQTVKKQSDISIVNEQLKATITGNVGGCLGETSTIALLIGGLYLLIRKTINYLIPVSVIASAVLFALIFYWIDPQIYMSPLMHLTTGGMLLCAFFIATDPVTAPLTNRGKVIFGVGVGAMIMLIRIVGEYPEGVMYAILLMNALSPLIDRLCKRVPQGGKPNA